MLLKLIKYDFREQFREHIGLYALVFVSALTEIILDSFEFDLVSVFFWALHSLSVIAMFICSLVIIVIYFRRNLLKDEGYLMNTLPVEPWKLYVSKFLTAFVLFILDLIVAILSFSIINQGFAWIGDIIRGMSDEFANAGFTASPVVMFGSIAIISLLYMISMLFFSLTTGYRAKWKQRCLLCTYFHHTLCDRSGRKYYSDDFYIFYSAVIKGIHHLYFNGIKPTGDYSSYKQSGHRCTCRIADPHCGVCRRLDIQYDKET